MCCGAMRKTVAFLVHWIVYGGMHDQISLIRRCDTFDTQNDKKYVKMFCHLMNFRFKF